MRVPISASKGPSSRAAIPIGGWKIAPVTETSTRSASLASCLSSEALEKRALLQTGEPNQPLIRLTAVQLRHLPSSPTIKRSPGLRTQDISPSAPAASSMKHRDSNHHTESVGREWQCLGFRHREGHITTALLCPGVRVRRLEDDLPEWRAACLRTEAVL